MRIFVWLFLISSTLVTMNLQAGQYVHPGVGVSTGGGIIARVGHFESWLGRRVDVIGDFFPNNTWDGWSNSG